MSVALGRSIVILALLGLVSLQCSCQSAAQDPWGVAMHPVKQLPPEPRSSAEISFEAFEIQQMFITHHPGMSEIKGEPTKGSRFFVEARIYSWEAIATAKFEAVDENGNVIQRILIKREPDPNGGSGFYGVMKIPDVPFRVVMSGEGIDGKSFRLTYERLFRPTTQPQPAILIPPGGPKPTAQLRQLYEKEGQGYLDKMEQEAKEIIVMPRSRASNVRYAPYFSKLGRPLGVRIAYDLEFSQDGYYNPQLALYLDYKKVDWRGRIEMTTLTGSIEPKPEEAGSPQVQPHILSFGAGYLYKAGTTYHFTAEYVPDFVIQNEQKTEFCIYKQKFNFSPQEQKAFLEILADNSPSPYTVSIGNTDFHGMIEGLPSQGTLYKSFLAEGAKDCGPQPTNRF